MQLLSDGLVEMVDCVEGIFPLFTGEIVVVHGLNDEAKHDAIP
jgi:hypothetical protein